MSRWEVSFYHRKREKGGRGRGGGELTTKVVEFFVFVFLLLWLYIYRRLCLLPSIFTEDVSCLGDLFYWDGFFLLLFCPM